MMCSSTSRRLLLIAVVTTAASSLVSLSNAFGVVVPIPSSQRQHTTTTTSTSRLLAEKEDSTTDILNSPEFLTRKLEVIKSDLAKAGEDIEKAEKDLEEGKEEWKDKFDELRKERAIAQDRMSKQSSDADGAATVEIATAMLNVLDNFDRAFGIVTPASDAEQEIEQKYRAAYQNLLDTLAELGVREVECVGTEFDYEQHNAVMTRPTDEYEEGVVMEELQKGFILAQKKEGGEDDEEEIKLIRAAMVVVAA